MGNGWISLHRTLLDWEWYTDANTMRLFIHLLLIANHSDKKYKSKIIKRGELITGREKLSAEIGLSVQAIRTSLKRLKSTNEITIESTSKGTLINIVNYSLFQGETRDSNQLNNQQANQPTTNQQPASNQQVTTNNNVNNNNKGIKSVVKQVKIETYKFPEAIETAIQGYIENRKAIKKPVKTEYAKKLLFNKVKKSLSEYSEEQVKTQIELSIQKNYTDVYFDNIPKQGNNYSNQYQQTGTNLPIPDDDIDYDRMQREVMEKMTNG